MENRASLKSSIAYNTFGTFFYFFCQWLTTIFVVRLSGYEDAGVLSMVISTTNIFYFIGLFGLRNFQVSDINKKYSDNDYIYARLVTIFISSILFIIAMLFLGYNEKTLLCSIAYLIYKFAEALSDVFFGIFQRYSNYKAIAISYTAKGSFTLIAFASCLYLTKNLLLTIIMVVLSYIIVLVFYDISNLKRLFKFKLRKFDVKSLLLICFPLMLYGLVVPYLNFMTRYAVESVYTTEILGYYSSVSMVFVVMSTLMGSVFISIIPKLAQLFYTKQFVSLKKMLSITVIGIALFGLFASIVASFLGDFVFSMLFGEKILDYMYLLIPTIIASLFLTYVSLFSSALIAFNKNKVVLYFNSISVFICSMTIFPFVEKFELLGSIWSLSLSLFITLFFLVVYTVTLIKKNSKSNL